MLIQGTISRLKEVFHENWIDSFFSELTIQNEVESADYTIVSHLNEQSDVQSPISGNTIVKVFDETQFRTFATDIRLQLYNDLNRSILNGNYVHAGFQNELNELYQLINGINYTETGDDKAEYLISDLIVTKVKKEIVSSIEVIQILLSEIQKRIFQSENTFIVVRDPTTQGFLRRAGESEEQWFLKINVQVALLDHFLRADIAYIRLLQKTLDSFQKIRIPQIKSVKDKCLFLMCKWYDRQEVLTQKGVFTSIDGSHTSLESIAEKCTINRHWKDKIDTHYELDNRSSSKIITAAEIILQTRGSEPKMCDLHTLVKYFKDLRKNQHELFKVVKEFEQIASKLDNFGYDAYCKNVAYSYALNNLLSYLIQQGSDDDEIDRLYYRIYEFQQTSGIRNYFPQYKYAIRKLEKLELKLSQQNFLDDLTEFKAEINGCEELLKTLERYIDWSKRNYNYVFVLPTDECMVKFAENESIFVASSFVLPLDLGKVSIELVEMCERLQQIKTSTSIYANIQEVVLDSKKRDVRSMETLGLFTALITFLSASASTFRLIETAFQAVLFTLALSSSLVTFIFLLLSVTREKGYFKRNIVFIAPIALMTILTWNYIIRQAELINKDSLHHKVEQLEKQLKRIKDRDSDIKE